MVLWFHGAVVPWFEGPGTFPTTLKITLPAMLFEHRMQRLLVTGATCYKIWGTHALRLSFIFLEIVISWYGPFTSLPFFRHSPRPEEQRVSRPQPDG